MPSSCQAWGAAPSIPTPTEHANKPLRGQPSSDTHIQPWPGRRKFQTPQEDVPTSLPSVGYSTGIPETPVPDSTESWGGSPAAPCWPWDHQHRGCGHPASPNPWRSHQPQEHAPLVAPAPKAKVMKKLFQAVPGQVLPEHRHPCVVKNVTTVGNAAPKDTCQPQQAEVTAGQKRLGRPVPAC